MQQLNKILASSWYLSSNRRELVDGQLASSTVILAKISLYLVKQMYDERK